VLYYFIFPDSHFLNDHIYAASNESSKNSNEEHNNPAEHLLLHDKLQTEIPNGHIPE